MQLFHFTNLMNLPGILAEGITLGEVPISPDPNAHLPTGASLTTDPNPNHQSDWCGTGGTNKTRIRISVEISVDRLTSFREMVKKYEMENAWVAALGPVEHRNNWYVAFDGVDNEEVENVELLIDDVYRELTDAETEWLIAEIAQEKETKIEVICDQDGLSYLFKNSSWLLDGPSVPSKPNYPWLSESGKFSRAN